MPQKRICSSDTIPAAVGPYSQAVAYGDLLFCSGIIAIDPADGEVVSGGIEQQTIRVLENLKLLLADLGTGMDQVLKTTVFLADMDSFGDFNAVYERYFPQDPPARSTIEAARLPLNVLIEVEAIVALPEK
ncbi:MAG: Rid family detoxifying hydrolase [Armatimonadota bacterium]